MEETIFHPQGGGQPSDQGVIEFNDSIFTVEKVSKNKDGTIQHFGKFQNKEKVFKNKDKVTLKIDKNFRILNVRLHSAGHLIDVAVRNIGLDKWIGTVRRIN